MKLIFQNAAATYARSLVALLLGLFSSRWVLQALGATDFGLYAVVGALVALFVFVGGLLNVSVARHYAFAIGAEGPGDDLRRWFSAAFLIHAVFALVVVAFGWPIGEWMVRKVLVIPAERIETCVIVFRLSLAAACVNLVAVPFLAMYTAQQRFIKLALFGLLQTFIMFFGALYLLRVEGDRLLVYAWYMAAAFVGPSLLQMAGAMIEFPACRGWFSCDDRGKLRAILAFAGWTFVGGGGWMIAYHGGAFVTNLFFGASANAAYGVSRQIQFHSEQLANALVGAFEPAVTASAGEGNARKFSRLVRQSELLGAGLFLLVAIPLFLLLDPVLKLWLVNPPEGTASVCRIMLAAMALDKLTTGCQLALNAKGRIAGWQATIGGVLAFSVVVAALFAWMGMGMTAVAWAYLVAYVGCATVNVLFARRLT